MPSAIRRFKPADPTESSSGSRHGWPGERAKLRTPKDSSTLCGRIAATTRTSSWPRRGRHAVNSSAGPTARAYGASASPGWSRAGMRFLLTWVIPGFCPTVCLPAVLASSRRCLTCKREVARCLHANRRWIVPSGSVRTLATKCPPNWHERRAQGLSRRMESTEAHPGMNNGLAAFAHRAVHSAPRLRMPAPRQCSKCLWCVTEP